MFIVIYCSFGNAQKDLKFSFPSLVFEEYHDISIDRFKINDVKW